MGIGLWACDAAVLSLAVAITDVLHLESEWPCEDREDGR